MGELLGMLAKRMARAGTDVEGLARGRGLQPPRVHVDNIPHVGKIPAHVHVAK